MWISRPWGRTAWLAAQFATAASTWPDPDSTTENVTRLQTAFFNVAVNGSDQLRQRVSLARARLLAVSAVNDTTFEQMVAYQRTLGDYAFDTYHDPLAATTLDPAMGDYLDMVNNAKATATTSANENYARESMQLFTLGSSIPQSTAARCRDGNISNTRRQPWRQWPR